MMPSDFSAPPRRTPGRPGCRNIAWMLLLVVLGVPAIVAWRAYHAVMLRREVAEGVNQSKRSRDAVEAYYAAHRALPLDDRQAGTPVEPAGGRFVERISIKDGTVSVTYGKGSDASISGTRLVFVPHPEGDRLGWTCDSSAGTTVPAESRPASCRR